MPGDLRYNVLLAISSIEKGNDGSLVKMNLGDGEFWEPRMSAASYHLHESSFGIEQIYLDDQRDKSYDVTCEISKADCENAPGSLCDAVSSVAIFPEDRRALESFDDAFDGDSNIHSRRRLHCNKNLDRHPTVRPRGRAGIWSPVPGSEHCGEGQNSEDPTYWG